jgi:hypothetical protein
LTHLTDCCTVFVKTVNGGFVMETPVARPAAAAAWAAVGVLWTLAILGLASIGWYVVPFALLATVLVARRDGRRGLLGFAAGACALTAALVAIAVLTR